MLKPKKLKINAKVKNKQHDKNLLIFKLFVNIYKLEISVVKTANQSTKENKYPTVLLMFSARNSIGISEEFLQQSMAKFTQNIKTKNIIEIIIALFFACFFVCSAPFSKIKLLEKTMFKQT